METEDYQLSGRDSTGGWITNKDRKFLTELESLIESNMASKDLNVDFIERTMKISHSSLYRKIKRLTGMSSRDYVMMKKMNHSIRLLTEGRNVSEAAYGSGFNDPGYFRKCFLRIYGILPSRFMRRIRNGGHFELEPRRKSDVKLT